MRLKSSMEIGKIDCYINFSVKAGKVIWGIDNLERAKKVPWLILSDEALGENSSRQLELYCQNKQAKRLILPTDYLNNLLKRSNVKVLSLTDESLSNAILRYCEE